MSKPSLIVCPQCNAQCLAEATQCWLCRGQLTPDTNIVLAEIVSTPRSSLSEKFFAVSTILLSLFVLLVGLGLFADQAGVGMLYFLVVAPAFIATAVRSRTRAQKQQQGTWAARFVTLMLSLSITGGIIGLLIAAAFVALLIACFVNPPNFH